MKWSSGFSPLCVSVCVVAAACSSATHRVCSPGEEAVPVVFVDAAALAIAKPETVQVCLDRECRPFGDTHLSGTPESESTTVLAVLDLSERTILIETRLGAVLAGPSMVEIPIVGAGCPGAALQGRFVVTDGGKIEQAP